MFDEQAPAHRRFPREAVQVLVRIDSGEDDEISRAKQN
jgi:hypothetical protein